jgi:putative DNA primase/helicase
VGVSEAALFRAIDMWQPTVITDEADTAFIDNEHLRAVYNAGWTRGTGVLRCVGDSHAPKLFNAFCPRAIGLKGKKLPDTTLSRCIQVEMRRKLARESVADFSYIDDSTLATLRRKLARWADDSWKVLAVASPQVPETFINRTRRNWWLLLAIAELAGTEWATKASKAATDIEGKQPEADAEIELLADIKAVFDDRGADEISTKELIAALIEDEERPWATWVRGNPITPNHLWRLLRNYHIASEDVRPNGAHTKGYRRVRFQEAWARYLAPQN